MKRSFDNKNKCKNLAKVKLVEEQEKCFSYILTPWQQLQQTHKSQFKVEKLNQTDLQSNQPQCKLYYLSNSETIKI